MYAFTGQSEEFGISTKGIYNVLSPHYDATFWCLFLHAFFLMFRKLNLVPNSVKQFDERKQLCTQILNMIEVKEC
jgi:hypothetical protein